MKLQHVPPSLRATKDHVASVRVAQSTGLAGVRNVSVLQGQLCYHSEMLRKPLPLPKFQSLHF